MRTGELAALLPEGAWKAIEPILGPLDAGTVELAVDHEGLLDRPGVRAVGAPRALACGAFLKGVAAASISKSDPAPRGFGARFLSGGWTQAWRETDRFWEVFSSANSVERVELRRSAYAAGAIGVPELDEMLARVHALHPIREATLRKGGARFYFVRPVPWPLWIRLDAATPFYEPAGALAPRLGALEVSSFALEDGRFEISIR